MDYDQYLKSGEFVDSDHLAVREYSATHVGSAVSDIDKAINFYYAIRDGIRYNPYIKVKSMSSYRASDAVLSKEGWCVPKAALMTACLRLNGIPARPGYADVKNHLASKRLLELLGSDLFPWHSYCEAYLDGKWVKSTPSFNLSLCEKFDLKPLEFDGFNDSIFHQFDQSGKKHMEYVLDRGTYFDVPMDEIVATFIDLYRPEYIENNSGDLFMEADADKNEI
jgi:transglutaminase-like putative cysteine protease